MWKELISEFFQEFLEFFFPEVHRLIDFYASFKTLNPELRGEEVTKGLRVADLLFEFTLNSGKPRVIIVHVEVQGYLEEEFAKRMYVYNYRAFDKYDKEVVSLAVLTDRNPSYRPSKYEFKLNGFG